MTLDVRMYVEWRRNETRANAARRTAIDALYHARDRGLNMHAAGAFAADAVLTLLDLPGGASTYATPEEMRAA